jgi:transcriptional regulator NrdR family protein
MTGRPYTCPNCSSTQTIWKGYRIVRAGRVRLRRCKDCGRKFTSRRFEEEAPQLATTPEHARESRTEMIAPEPTDATETERLGDSP